MKLGSVGSLIKVPPKADPLFGRINRCAELWINVISVGFRDRRDPTYLQEVAELAARKGVELRRGGRGYLADGQPIATSQTPR